MQGPDSWAGRPRDIPTVRVSTLSPALHAKFKKYFGKRRWTTPQEVQRLIDIDKFKFAPDSKGEPHDHRP